MITSAQFQPVVCLGEALIDRLGPPGGDPAVDLPVDDRLGGAPANVACGLARLGTPVAFAGRLGQDAIGEAFSNLFAERGVDTVLLQRDAERPAPSDRQRPQGSPSGPIHRPHSLVLLPNGRPMADLPPDHLQAAQADR